jgi:transcriptional regulator with XRE-family HTH domain
MAIRDRGIGPRIADARRKAGLSQTELASLTGNSARTVEAWERGVRHPRYDAMQGLAAALEHEVAWFYEPVEAAA